MIDSELVVGNLGEIVGAVHVSSAPADVSAYGGLAPIVVVWPAVASEVAQVLEVCDRLGVSAMIAGAGTRTHGHWPVDDERPRIALDCGRMVNILQVNTESLTVHCQAGIRVAHLEVALRRQKLTLGYLPPELGASTVGGLLSAPHPKAHSPQYGWFTERCIALSVADPHGRLMHQKPVPRSAAGPDLLRLYIGSRGALGAIVSAVLRVCPEPEHELAVACAFSRLDAALATAHGMLGQGITPAGLWVLDGAAAREAFGDLGVALPALLISVFNGSRMLTARHSEELLTWTQQSGGIELPETFGRRHLVRLLTAAPAAAATTPATEAGTRLPHSALRTVAVNSPFNPPDNVAIQLSFDQFDRHGATMWLTLRAERAKGEGARTMLLDAGFEPLRASFPAGFERLRAALDPRQTLVVMES